MIELNESEWRTIHNSLSHYQSQVGSYRETLSDWAVAERKKLQQLMDKIRDNFIAPTNEPQTPSAR